MDSAAPWDSSCQACLELLGVGEGKTVEEIILHVPGSAAGENTLPRAERQLEAAQDGVGTIRLCHRGNGFSLPWPPVSLPNKAV